MLRYYPTQYGQYDFPSGNLYSKIPYKLSRSCASRILEKPTFFHDCLDTAKAADFVIPLLSSTAEADELGIDVMTGLARQGCGAIMGGIYAQQLIAQKKRMDVKKSLKDFLFQFSPQEPAIFDIEDRNSLSLLIRPNLLPGPEIFPRPRQQTVYVR